MMERWQALVGALGPDAIIAVAFGVAVLVLAVLAALLTRRKRIAGRSETVTDGKPGVRTVGEASFERGLAKTRAGFFGRLLPLLGRSRLDPAEVESLEAALLAADVGVRTTGRLLEAVRRSGAADESLQARLEREIRSILETSAREPQSRAEGSPSPHVIMVVGVNGVGKTTSIGKLAARYVRNGKRVLLVAGDTFRAAAIEQLAVWAERTGADLVRHQHGADPGAVAYDGLRAAIAREVDVVIVDTAGRLHTKSNLMDELRKVRRVIGRELPGAPHETLLVVDAVTGQNGLAQARAFLEQIDVTGVVLTKLDGTAKGGIVLAIAGDLQLPIRFVGVGEGVEDLHEFDPEAFASALLAPAEPTGMP